MAYSQFFSKQFFNNNKTLSYFSTVINYHYQTPLGVINSEEFIEPLAGECNTDIHYGNITQYLA